MINFYWTSVPTLPSETVLGLHSMGMKQRNHIMEA